MDSINNTVDFLKWLYAHCETGNLNFRFLRDEDKGNEFIPVGILFEEPGQICQIIEKHSKLNSFFGVALREGNNGKKEGVTAAPALWVDLDDAPLQAVQESQFPPSAVIETRPGRYHVYWKLREPLGREDIGKVENTLKRLRAFFHGDPAATDASRILRIPGTLNFKTDPPQRVTVKALSPLEYELDDFGDLPELEPSTVDVYSGNSSNGDRIKKIMECVFLQHCDRDRAKLPEPEWYAMISLLAREIGGPAAIHGLSRGYPKYSARETDQKILHALNTPPMTCQKVKGLWSCGKDCGVRSPASLSFKKPAAILTPSNDFPREAIGGLAGEFADLLSHYLESPWTFFANNFLTCLGNIVADRVTLQSSVEPEPRLYCVNVGESADDRKSESIKKTNRFFETTMDSSAFKTCHGVGSAEGLANRLKENPKTILIFDELKVFVSKSGIEGATLLPCVNSLFEDTRFHSATKTHSVQIDDAHLSLLAASTLETFSRMWTPAFLNIGFLNRLWLVKDRGERRYSIPREIPEGEIKTLRRKLGELLKSIPEEKVRLPIDEEARAIFDAWYFGQESSPFCKRLDGYGLRLMILLAVNAGEPRITPGIVSRVVSLLQWQLEVRRELDPVDAEGGIARMEELIRRTLSRGPMGKRDLMRKVHTERSGLFTWNTATRNLQQAGEVFIDRRNQTYSLRG